MKVLLLSLDLFAHGGIQRYSRYEIQALRAFLDSEDVRLCSQLPPGSDQFDVPLAADVVGEGRSRAAKVRFALATWRFAREQRPDLVICDHVNLSPLAYLYKLLTGTPYILNVYAIEVWGRLRIHHRLGLTRADQVVSDCEFTKKYLEQRYPALARKLSVIPDCVDCERFTPAAAPGDLRARLGLGDGPILLTVSRLPTGRSKGHDHVMRAVADLRSEGVRLTYVIAGDGPDRPRLASLAKDLGIADAVVFLGRVSEELLPDLYRVCDVFILVSSFQMHGKQPQGEGVPLVVLEAQASGKPVITSRLDGSAEAIVDGETGLLVDPSDSPEIAAALRRLFGDSDARLCMGQAARTLAEQKFSFDVFREAVRATCVRLSTTARRR